MSMDVADIRVYLPDKEAVSAAATYQRRKPSATVKLSMENDDEWVLYTPVKVARLYRRDLPSLPKEYDELLEGLKKLEHKVAMNTLGEMLSRKDYSRGELSEKLLKQGFRQDTTQDVVDRACELKLVDDMRFAKIYIEQKKLSGWGRRRIELELRRKKVDPSELPGYPETFFDDDEDLERALVLLSRKAVPEKKPYEKLCNFLIRKGFNYGTANKAVKSYLSEEDA